MRGVSFAIPMRRHPRPPGEGEVVAPVPAAVVVAWEPGLGAGRLNGISPVLRMSLRDGATKGFTSMRRFLLETEY